MKKCVNLLVIKDYARLVIPKVTPHIIVMSLKKTHIYVVNTLA